MNTTVFTPRYAYRGVKPDTGSEAPANGYQLLSHRKWQNNLEDLKKFIAENGRLPGRDNVPELEMRLGMWISWNNRQYRLGLVTESQRTELLSVHPEMKSRIHGMTNEQRWEHILQEISLFTSKHGRLPVNSSMDEGEKKLRSWISRQRTKAKINLLSERQLQLIADSHALVSKILLVEE